MKRQGIGLNALVLFALTIICISCVVAALPITDAQDVPKKNFAGQRKYRVVSIVNSITVELMIDDKATTVRMMGVDEPEELPHRREACIFVTDLLKGEEVFMEQVPGNTAKVIMAYLYRAPDGGE